MWLLIAVGWATALVVFLGFVIGLCKAAALGDILAADTLSRAEINCEQFELGVLMSMDDAR